MNKNPFECENHMWSNHEHDKTCLTCGVYGWKNYVTGELEPGGFRGPQPLACLKASNPSDPRCELSVRSFNVLMNVGLKSKDEVRDHIVSGKLSAKKTRNLGKLSMKELIHWSGINIVNPTFSNGTVVKYKNGWMQVRAVFKETVNLGPIFGSKTTIKKVSHSEVYPDYDNWNAAWSKSETYQSM